MLPLLRYSLTDKGHPQTHHQGSLLLFFPRSNRPFAGATGIPFGNDLPERNAYGGRLLGGMPSVAQTVFVKFITQANHSCRIVLLFKVPQEIKTISMVKRYVQIRDKQNSRIVFCILLWFRSSSPRSQHPIYTTLLSLTPKNKFSNFPRRKPQFTQSLHLVFCAL
jgi:hypothetical protein